MTPMLSESKQSIPQVMSKDTAKDSMSPTFVTTPKNEEEEEMAASKSSLETLLTSMKYPGIVPILADFQIRALEKYNKKEEIGGKAFGLNLLQSIGFGEKLKKVTVPGFWVIRCSYHTTPADWAVAVQPIPRQGLYSVRSGAPISMPGMMDTVLNVPYSALLPAIKKVWESYKSERAIAYRKDNNISDDIGTAVIIQRMVPAKYSGVCFTHNVNEPHKKSVFNPAISYVSGAGDGLVGGTVASTDMAKTHEDYSRWCEIFKKIVAEHGPSDIEFCKGFDDDFYLLQQRSLKFIELDASGIKDSPDEADKVIVGGTSIGYPGRMTLKVVKNLSEAAKGTALYVKEFTPDTYSAMMKADAIISHIGGPQCHAGIVSREAHKPAISGIEAFDIAPYIGETIIVDGKTGCLYTKKVGVEMIGTTPLETLRHIVPAEERIPRLSIRSRKDSKSLRGDKMAARFYHIVHNDSVPQETKDLLIKDIALAAMSYGWMICLGEARHAKGKKNNSGTTLGTTSFQLLKSLGVRVADGLGRSGLVSSIHQMGYANSVSAIEACKHVFNDLNWGGGYGGPPWGKIADVVRGYMVGELNENLFLDSFFNLKHNNGTLFNKFEWCTFGDNMKSLLDVKQRGTLEEFSNFLTESGLMSIATSTSLFLAEADMVVPTPTEPKLAALKDVEYEDEDSEDDDEDDEEKEEEEEFYDEDEEEQDEDEEEEEDE